MLFDGFLEPDGGALRPDLARPGLGVELKRADAERVAPPDGAARRPNVDARGARGGAARRDRGRGPLQPPATVRSTPPTGSNYRQLPIGVVIPRTIDDVVAAVAVCREHGAPILSRGGGTSLAGQCVNVAVVLDFSKYLNRIIEIDPERKLARVEPGVVLDRLRERGRGSTGSPSAPIPRRTTTARSAG